jgi:predicted TIM-barrel fold metal-dependent hydrolase
MTDRLGLGAAVLAASLLASCASPVHPSLRQQVDSRLAAEIESIPAIDNHAHPMRAVNEGEKDTEFDALPVEMMEPYDTPPLRMRPDNPEYIRAWHDLFGYRHEDMAENHVKGLVEAKRRVMREKGDGYPVWVLDRLGIGIMFANRVAMGRGLPPARFKWVPYADALMYPFNDEALSRRDPDRKAFFGAEDKLLRRYLAEAGVSGMPATLDEYLRFVSSTLERWKKNGAVAVKLEMAYLRSLDVGDPDRAVIERLYATYSRSGIAPNADYKSVQDFLFRHIAAECGRLGMPLHFHSSAGAGRYFDVAGVNPMLLLPVIIDPAMRKTNFVFVHASWPYTRELTALLDKPNIYLDISAQPYLLYPRALAENIRGFLEYAPEKVLFGTDASPITDAVNWEETGWMASNTGREALALALTGMLRDQEIDRDRASRLARMVLRENAIRLYGFR